MLAVRRPRKFSALHYADILQKIKKKLKFKFTKKNKIFDMDVNQSIIEEVAGNLSSSVFIGFFALEWGTQYREFEGHAGIAETCGSFPFREHRRSC